MTNNFEELTFRGKTWYDAEQVDQKIYAMNAEMAALNENWEEVEVILDAVARVARN